VITESMDFAQICVYLFWFFFFGLIVYLRREDKREGYPLESDRTGVTVEGWPATPPPKPERAKHPALATGGASPPEYGDDGSREISRDPAGEAGEEER